MLLALEQPTKTPDDSRITYILDRDLEAVRKHDLAKNEIY